MFVARDKDRTLKIFLIGLLMLMVMVSCGPKVNYVGSTSRKLEQRPLTVERIEVDKWSQDNKTIVHYYLKSGKCCYLIDFVDTVGRFQVGDTLDFVKISK